MEPGQQLLNLLQRRDEFETALKILEEINASSEIIIMLKGIISDQTFSIAKIKSKEKMRHYRYKELLAADKWQTE